MEKLLCPSMMCADFNNLKKEVVKLDEAGADVFHIDVMDGNFVPNFAMGLEDFKCIRENTKKMVDVHLMVENPVALSEIFCKMGADIVYVHYETDVNIARTYDNIHKYGKKTGLAINPATSFETVKNILHIEDYVMIMTVNPGFAGQSYLEYIDEKIEEFIQNRKKYHYEIVVDGGISEEKIKKLNQKGVKGFILGTSSLFGKGDYVRTIKKLRVL